jgi:hypothetical protein
LALPAQAPTLALPGLPVDQVRWLGIEHKPHRPSGFAQHHRPDGLTTLRQEVCHRFWYQRCWFRGGFRHRAET